MGQATIFFPGDSILKNITCVAQITQDKSSLPHNITAVTDIYSLTLSDPEAYDPETEGNIQFAVANPYKYSVVASYKKYGGASPAHPASNKNDRQASSAANPWYRIGGTVSGNTMEAPIPKYSGKFLVGTQSGDTVLKVTVLNANDTTYLQEIDQVEIPK